MLLMFPRQLYAVLLAFLLESPASYVAAEQQPFVGASAVKSGQVKSVLEREPVREPACKQFVRSVFRSVLTASIDLLCG